MITAPVVKAPPKIEQFYRLKAMPGATRLFSVERITIEDDIVSERKVITERDMREIALHKIRDLINLEHK